MRNARLGLAILLLTGLVACIAPNCGAQAAATGAIEFVARVRPTGGQPEPVRQIPFYALRQSLDDIRQEAERSASPVAMDQFIDGLERSPELKAWMKEHKIVDFAGVEFTTQVKADDVIAVPEFLEAYKTQNAAVLKEAVPEPKPKPSDEKNNSEKVAHAKAQYIVALRRFITANPESIQGLDAEFLDKNPHQAWERAQAEQQRHVMRLTLELAQSQYLSGHASTDLDGRGAITALAPGTYWLTTLDTPALAGDVRLQWDLPVTVRAGETARVELTNLNALDPSERTAP